MSSQIIDNVNLLKKYTKPLVFDYTEYPTKAFWDEGNTSITYEKALEDWLVNQNGGENSLFYVHTPFCEQLCYFCLCSKEITKDYEKVKDYLYNVLFKEIDMLVTLFKKIGKAPSFKEIYFGGGSPTYYKDPEFKALKEKMGTLIDYSKIDSWTVEVDPRRVDTNKLKFYHSQGVNRLSFGIQDFDLGVQKEINRIQTPELVDELLTKEIRDLFPVINFDLLVGLPRQTIETFERTIDEVIKLKPSQLQTMYVHYKPDTRRYMTNMVKNVPLPDFYDRRAIFLAAKNKLTDGGYSRAGFESYALPDDELTYAIENKNAYYNSLGTQKGGANNFVAVGSSAHSSFGEYYFQNFYERNLYTDAVLKGEFPVYRGFKLNEEDNLRRHIIKTIRTYFKINYNDYEKSLDKPFVEHFKNEIELLKVAEKDGILKLSNDGFVLTDLGQHLSPHICEIFDAYNSREVFNENIPIFENISINSANR
ncbi:radical SAM protein [Alphaproteobacteria bacterium]|nr:radical SAM protein [Alphaproteobacteria bacterium]